MGNQGSHAYADAILGDPRRFKRLNVLYRIRNNSPQDTRRLFFSKLLPHLAKGAALAGVVAAVDKLRSRGRPMTRRQFFIRALASTALIGASRYADIASTCKFLGTTQRMTAQIRTLKEFKRLPPDVQKQLLPDTEQFEINQRQRKAAIRAMTEGDAHSIAKETLCAAALTQVTAALLKQPQLGLQLAVFHSATGASVAQRNLELANIRYPALLDPRKVAKELADLHALVNKR
ncbi:MAG: hypothetical protein AABW54_04675 [Candidatus Micrarchaeota archaeon]